MQQSAVYLGGVHTSSVFLGKVVGFEVLIFSDKNRMRQKMCELRKSQDSRAMI